MNYGYAFSFQFKDEQWIKKIAIAALFILIPIIGPLFLAGWGLEITRRVIVQDPEPLPDWDDFGGYIVKGLQLIIIGFVYALPVILIQACTQGLYFGLGADQVGSDDAMAFVTIVAQTCMGCISFLYTVFLGVYLPAAIGHFAAEGEFGAAFRFGEIFRILKAGLAGYLIILLASFVLPFVAMLGLMFCLIGALFTFPYTLTAMQYLYGEAYRASKEEMAFPTDLEPDVPPIAGA
jgi:hypothetical protein